MSPALPTIFPGWTIIDLDQVTSTNDLAVREPIWPAVRAKRQTAGRGRHHRSWISGEGGLWLSAVLPASAETTVLTAPLVAGLAFARALEGLGVRPIRLRWPNDLMVEDRKLGGILVERPAPDRLVIGLGLNVVNDPERENPELSGLTTSLARLGHGTIPLSELSQVLLEALQRYHEIWMTRGFPALLPAFESLWGPARLVRVTIDQTTVTGRFLGIDAVGNLRLETPSGNVQFLYGPHVWQLVEI